MIVQELIIPSWYTAVPKPVDVETNLHILLEKKIFLSFHQFASVIGEIISPCLSLSLLYYIAQARLGVWTEQGDQR